MNINQIAANFNSTAKSLSRNPLGIIALFIAFIYGLATIVIVSSSNLLETERLIIVIFLSVFPVIVLFTFAWLVACHHKKLYAPQDYNSDSAFLIAENANSANLPNIHQLESQIENKVSKVLQSKEIKENISKSKELDADLAFVAQQISSELKNTVFISIDAKEFTGDEKALFEVPADAFYSFGQFTDQVFYLISKHVGPYEYGTSWVLRKADDNSIIKNARMITNSPPGRPIPDKRSLHELGIKAGTSLIVSKM